MTSVMMTWQAASTFGWGILGLNVFCHWAVDPDITPLMAAPITQNHLRLLDPLRQAAIREAVAESNTFAIKISQTQPDAVLQMDCPVIHHLGNGFPPTRFRGTVNIGRAIFEDTRLTALAEKMARYDVVLVASTWARDLVQAHTGKPVHVIHEGVDPSVFCPGPKSGLLNPQKFYVFSGGKIEFRKAQDLVVAGFRLFARRHDDAVLVTSWHSPWPKISEGFTGILQEPVRLDHAGRVDAAGWAAANGIPAAQFVDVGTIPNQLMPHVLREMDVSLQPSRAEACTNLPATEAMACGIPVILADNTGVRDLVRTPGTDHDDQAPSHCLPLRFQRPVKGFTPCGTEGWGESDVEEIVSALEFVYTNRQGAREIGQRGAAWMIANRRTWYDHARDLKSLVLSL